MCIFGLWFSERNRASVGKDVTFPHTIQHTHAKQKTFPLLFFIFEASGGQPISMQQRHLRLRQTEGTKKARGVSEKRDKNKKERRDMSTFCSIT